MEDLVVPEQNKYMKKTSFLLITLTLAFSINAQEHPFYNQKKAKTQQYKKGSSVNYDVSTYQILFFDGLRYKTLGSYDKAIDKFLACIELDGSLATPMYELAQIYFLERNYEKSQFFAESACEIQKDNKWFLMLLSNVYMANNQPMKAIPVLKKAIEFATYNEELYFQLSDAYLMANQPRNAIKVYNQIESIMGKNSMLYQQKKDVFEKSGNRSSAIKEINKWLEFEPNNLEARAQLSELYLLDGKLTSAIKSLEEMLLLDSLNGTAHLMLSELYRTNKQFENSFESTAKAFLSTNLGIDAKMRALLTYYEDLDNDSTLKAQAFALIELLKQAHPDDAKPYTIEGDFYYREDSLLRAKNAFVEALKYDKSRFPIWQQVLIISFDTKDYAAVISTAKEAEELFPSQPIIYYLSGLAHLQTKSYNLAIDQLNTSSLLVISNDPLLAQIYATLGDAYHAVEDHKESDRHYEKSLALVPENANVLNNYSYYLSLRNENLERAVQMMKQCMMLSPNFSTYEDTFAWVYYMKKDYEKAKFWIDKAMGHENDPPSPTIIEHGGDIYFKLGFKEKAISFWKLALEKGADSEFIHQKIEDEKLYE